MSSKLVVPNMKTRHEPTKRNDMERTGLFSNVGALRSPIAYIDNAVASALRPELRQGKQMIGRGPKIRAANRDWAFDKEERRIFEGDCQIDPVRFRHQTEIASRKKDVAGRWIPPKGHTNTCGFNTFYDTFAGRIDALSAAQRQRPPKNPYHPDFVAVHPKSGSFGWNGFTLSKFPVHLPDPYDGPSLTKEMVEEDLSTEQTRRMNRAPYKAFGKIGFLFFEKNPFFVKNPPTEFKNPLTKKVPNFLNSQNFKPPAHPKPMKRMKYWGTFHKVEDLGGKFVQQTTNPFRVEFHGKQNLLFPLKPPAATKKVLVTPITVANMAGQMDSRKIDKQVTVYGENARKISLFPEMNKISNRLQRKGVAYKSELYRKPEMIKGILPLQNPTVAPANKQWFS